MKVEEFTQQGFKECPPELLPALMTPMNQESKFFVKELYKIKDTINSYLVLEENGSKSKLKIIYTAKTSGWGEHIMNLNIE